MTHPEPHGVEVGRDPRDDDYDDDYEPEEEEFDPGEECGRWINGRLTGSCTKAGSEECDWECPYRGSLYRRTK